MPICVPVDDPAVPGAAAHDLPIDRIQTLTPCHAPSLQRCAAASVDI